MIKKNITFTDRLEEMVKELEEKKGYPSFSAVVHQAIIDMHNKAFPSYVREASVRETPEDRVRRKKEIKEAKEALAREEQLEIMADLEGDLVQTDTGEFVRYYTYTNSKRFEQQVSLSSLTPDLVKTQYQPSREKVEKLRAEGKVDY